MARSRRNRRAPCLAACAVAGACVAQVVIAAPPARADTGATRPAQASAGGRFWSHLLHPHEAEIRAILARARHSRRQAARRFPPFDYRGYSEANQRARDRLLAAAERALEHGLKLAPGRPALLLELGRVADDRQRAAVAERALAAYLRRVRPAELQPDAELRLGRIYALERRWRDAATELRLALGNPYLSPLGRIRARFALAGVAMRRRRLGDAIDLLGPVASGALTPRGYYDGELWLRLALAVAYDRDEQITRARDTLDSLLSTGNQDLLAMLCDCHIAAHVRFVPPLDALYFRALVLEATGHLPEARAEWQTYAAGGADAVYRRRARAHVAAIDRLLARRRPLARRSRMPRRRQLQRRRGPRTASRAAPRPSATGARR